MYMAVHLTRCRSQWRTLYKAFNPINNHNPGSEKNTEFYDLQLSKIQVLFLDAIGFQVGSYMVSM